MRANGTQHDDKLGLASSQYLHEVFSEVLSTLVSAIDAVGTDDALGCNAVDANMT